MEQLLPYLIVLLAFGAVSVLIFVVGQFVSGQARLQRRLSMSTPAAGLSAVRPPEGALQRFVSRHFDEKRFGIDTTLRGKIRSELLKAGYFRNDVVNYYIFVRLAVAVIFPTVCYLVLVFFFGNLSVTIKLVSAALSIVVAIIGPDIFIDQKQRRLAQHYREVFPDVLDLLVVCTDAGLSLEAALDRVTSEIAKQSRELGLNLLMMSAEMRAGRSTIEALDSLADRLMIDEAGSFVIVLRQSLELGSDVGDTLRVYSDEMREKRIMRAEETANKLPVKLSFPMGLFIFPVILMVVMLPVVIRMMAAMSKY
jgi:tight adherence protein C